MHAQTQSCSQTSPLAHPITHWHLYLFTGPGEGHAGLARAARSGAHEAGAAGRCRCGVQVSCITELPANYSVQRNELQAADVPIQDGSRMLLCLCAITWLSSLGRITLR